MLSFLLLSVMGLHWAASDSPPGREGIALPKVIETLFQVTHLGPWEENLKFSSVSCEELNKTTETTLFLVNRSLKSFPHCLPRALQSLDLSSNWLKELRDQDLRDLPNLRVLILRNNLIQELHWGGTPVLENLETLDLSYNKLSSMPTCQTMMLQNLTWLSLAGNPILEIQPWTFSCFPSLHFLNLSATLLGKNDREGIKESAFAQRILSQSGEKMYTMEVLDLSRTFLPEIQLGWIKDLPNLRSLYLKKMARLKSLDGQIFKATSNLRVLDCQDSQALSSVNTQIFEDTPHLQSLLLQNCNLSSFQPWTLNSSQVILISLYGNPLSCSCKLSWLLSNPGKMVLSRSDDTVCTPAADPDGTFSPSLSLPQLYSKCHSERHTAFIPSSPLSLESSADGSVSTKPLRGLNPPGTLASLAFRQAEPTPLPALGTPGITKDNSLRRQEATLERPSLTLPTQGVGSTAVILSTIPPGGAGDTVRPPRAGSAAHTQLRGESAPGKTAPNRSTPRASTSGATSGSTPFPGQPPRSPSLPSASTSHPRSASSPSAVGIPVFMLDDYSSEEEEEEETDKLQAEGLCDYHPCRHLQTPCDVLQKSSRCLCPGLSGEDAIPDPPKLQEVSQTTDTSALVHWCAPNSVVRMYQLIYHPEARAEKQTVVREIYALAREHPLHGLSPSTTYNVCVLASNKAGLSLTRTSEWRKACATFTTKPSFLFIFAGLCGTSGLLLLSTFVLSVCLYRKCKTRQGEQYDTHLVSYKNPAFDYPLKLQTLSL